MKKFLFGLLLTCGLVAQGQVFNNEWIDYSKTYYKIKVGKTGLFRISQSVLSTAGLSGTPAEYYQSSEYARPDHLCGQGASC